MTEIEKLLDVMRQLRDPVDGCPWDVEQTFETIAPYTIEEAYEVAEAIADKDYTGLRSELGDLLLQVVFHSQMATEQGLFDFEDVAASINKKMQRRHPHVFGTQQQRAAGAVEGSWEAIKADERGDDADRSVLAGVTRNLPALMRAEKLGKRAARVGFDWPDQAGVRAKIDEELDEVADAVGTRSKAQVEEEVGDLLFAVVNFARHLGVDAEQALTTANRKFEARFRVMEAEFAAGDESMHEQSLETLEQAWRRAKRHVEQG